MEETTEPLNQKLNETVCLYYLPNIVVYREHTQNYFIHYITLEYIKTYLS